MLLGAVVEREEERLLVSGAAKEVEIVLVAAVEEALVEEFAVDAAEEDEVACLSSDLLVSLCWDSDCIFS